MAKSLILEKAIAFALRIVKVCRWLAEEKREYVLSKQLLISGTFIGKHVREATSAESRQAFLNEMAIALRKTSETEYWLVLLESSGYLTERQAVSLADDRAELARMLTRAVKTTRATF